MSLDLMNALKNLGEIKESGWKYIDGSDDKKTINSLDPSAHKIYFKKEKRKGKIVTLIGEFFLSSSDLEDLMKLFKKKLAVGGAIEDRFLMLQSDKEEKIKELIKEQNFGLKKP